MQYILNSTDWKGTKWKGGKETLVVVRREDLEGRKERKNISTKSLNGRLVKGKEGKEINEKGNREGRKR